jgi:hypothetical protein
VAFATGGTYVPSAGAEVRMDKKAKKKPYANPKVEMVTVKQLREAIGPAQGLSSGASSSVAPLGKTNHGRGHRRGRGGRH